MVGMGDLNTESFSSKMMDILPTIRNINEQFKDPVSSNSTNYSVSVTFMIWKWCEFSSFYISKLLI